MAIRVYKPMTAGTRQRSVLTSEEITKTTPEKSLTVTKKKTNGRNNQGKITVRHRGGGVKRKYRLIDFKRRKDGVTALVSAIEYDPNRSANIALITYKDGELLKISLTNEYSTRNNLLISKKLILSHGEGTESSSTLNYMYDATNRLSQIVRPEQYGNVSYSYDVHGWPVKIESNSFKEELSYSDGSLCSERHYSTGEMLYPVAALCHKSVSLPAAPAR